MPTQQIPCPQTSAFPCPTCHGATRTVPITRTLRLNGLPLYLSERMRFAKQWTCPTCATRAGEIPFTYLTFGGMNFRNLIVATYHQGMWSLAPHTPLETINAITRIENGQTPATVGQGTEEELHVQLTTPRPPTPTRVETRPQEFTPPDSPSFAAPVIRVKVDSTYFAREANGRVFQWRHVMQPVELGHWEQIGTAASEDTAGLFRFCQSYLQSRFLCDCGAGLDRDAPTNVYRRGLSEQQVREVESNTADYYHCNDNAHHSDGDRRGFLRFSDGTVLEYHGESWVPRRNQQAANLGASVSPRVGVDPNEVLRLLQDKLFRETAVNGINQLHPEECLANAVASFLAGGRTVRTEAQVRFIIEFLMAIGYDEIANNLVSEQDDEPPETA